MGDVTTENATESVTNQASAEKREERSSEELINRWVWKCWVYSPIWKPAWSGRDNHTRERSLLGVILHLQYILPAMQ